MGKEKVVKTFCKNLSTPEKRSECEAAVRDMFKGGNLELDMEKLSEVTGKTTAELADYMGTHCPLCEDGVPHEH